MYDNRKEARLDLEDLPESLQSVLIVIDETHVYEAVTVNASSNGMGFIVENLNGHDINVDQRIMLKDFNESFVLDADVVYINKVDKNRLQVGVEFDNDETNKKYQYLVIPDTSY